MPLIWKLSKNFRPPTIEPWTNISIQSLFEVEEKEDPEPVSSKEI